MNILYIIGNGFDKAQGLRTSYPEFYNYLEVIKDKGLCSNLMIDLINEIKSDTEYWSDMEVAFGKYTERIKSEQEFELLYFELNDHLRSYLEWETVNYKPTSDNQSSFLHDFINVNYFLGGIDKSRFERIRKSIIKGGVSSLNDISVMTFNYTNTLEKLTADTNIDKIIHVHGALDNEIILGVDNDNQIANESFRANVDIKDFLVKNQSIISMKYDRSYVCEQLIKEAHIIILFGVSLGETDSRWWKLIGEQFKEREDVLIIQYIYSPDTTGRPRKQLTGRIERKMTNELLKKIGINKEEMNDKVLERLFFIVNSKAFNNDSVFNDN